MSDGKQIFSYLVDGEWIDSEQPIEKKANLRQNRRRADRRKGEERRTGDRRAVIIKNVLAGDNFSML